MTNTFGYFIRQLRISKGLTLIQLSNLLNLDYANLSKIENDKRILNENKLTQLAALFNIDIEELKTEYYSDLIAKKIYYSNCNDKVFIIALKKFKELNTKKKSFIYE